VSLKDSIKKLTGRMAAPSFCALMYAVLLHAALLLFLYW
jgi:hypothetical protein